MPVTYHGPERLDRRAVNRLVRFFMNPYDETLQNLGQTVLLSYGTTARESIWWSTRNAQDFHEYRW